MKFTIDRSKWRCGGSWEKNVKGKGDTELLNTDGYRCCLGFVCNQIGFEDKHLLEVGIPEEIAEDYYYDVKKDNDVSVLFDENRVINSLAGRHSVYFNNKLTETAISINDDRAMGVIEREVKLTELFKKYGHELEFTGEYEN